MGPPALELQILERLAAIERQLAAICERLPAPALPDKRLDQLLEAVRGVVGEAKFALLDLFEESEASQPLCAALVAVVGRRRGQGTKRLAAFISRHKVGREYRFERVGRLWCIRCNPNPGIAPGPRQPRRE